MYKLLRQFEKSEKKLHKPSEGCLGEEIKFNNNQVILLQFNNDSIIKYVYINELDDFNNFKLQK